MPTKKKCCSPSKKCCPSPKMNLEQGIDEAKKIGQEAVSKIKELKNKYDKLDSGTKKQIGAAVAGLAALIAGAAIAKKATSKKRK